MCQRHQFSSTGVINSHNKERMTKMKKTKMLPMTILYANGCHPVSYDQACVLTPSRHFDTLLHFFSLFSYCEKEKMRTFEKRH